MYTAKKVHERRNLHLHINYDKVSDLGLTIDLLRGGCEHQFSGGGAKKSLCRKHQMGYPTPHAPILDLSKKFY